MTNQQQDADDFYLGLTAGWVEDFKKIKLSGLKSIKRRGAVLEIVTATGKRVSFVDNTDYCTVMYNYMPNGRRYSFDAYHVKSGMVSVFFIAHTESGINFVRLLDGAVIESDEGSRAIEAPDGRWIALLERGLGYAGISFWDLDDWPLKKKATIAGIKEARFTTPTSLEVDYAEWLGRESYRGVIELRDGVWMEIPR